MTSFGGRWVSRLESLLKGQSMRNFYSTQRSLNAERTTISKFDVLNSSLAPTTLLIRSIVNHGLTLGNLQVRGPCVVLNNSLFLWDVPQFGVGGPFDGKGLATNSKKEVVDDPTSPFHGWTTDVFKLFEVVHPLPDILVIGTGHKLYQLPPHLKAHLHSLGMQTEVLDSRSACSTFNILVQEGRRPAAAILPRVPTSARTGETLVELKKK